VLEMQRLGYFGNGVGWALGAEEVPEPEGKLVVFEAFFIVGLRVPTHRFVVEVLRMFEVQVHQLTPNVVAHSRSMSGPSPHTAGSHLWRSSRRITVCPGRR
jgi:hypothetical protein